jgi:hypothetical protein
MQLVPLQLEHWFLNANAGAVMRNMRARIKKSRLFISLSFAANEALPTTPPLFITLRQT